MNDAQEAINTMNKLAANIGSLVSEVRSLNENLSETNMAFRELAAIFEASEQANASSRQIGTAIGSIASTLFTKK